MKRGHFRDVTTAGADEVVYELVPVDLKDALARDPELPLHLQVTLSRILHEPERKTVNF